jgi:hypothetical protein
MRGVLSRSMTLNRVLVSSWTAQCAVMMYCFACTETIVGCAMLMYSRRPKGAAA